MQPEHNYLQTFADWIDFSADVLTLIASAIAIYLFFFKGKRISSAINVLLGFTSQVTLSELHSKLDELDRLKLRPDTSNDEGAAVTTSVINTFKAIEGQIIGNTVLYAKLSKIVESIDEFTSKPSKMVEWKKLRLTSELREQLRSLNVQEYHNVIK